MSITGAKEKSLEGKLGIIRFKKLLKKDFC